MEELNYVTVSFRADGVPIYEKTKVSAVIYDEVQPRSVQSHAHTGSRGSALMRPATLRVVAACLTVTCLTLLSVVITIILHFNKVISEQERVQSDLTERIEWLQEAQVGLEREAVELSEERDRLNWTLGVILEYQNFPVVTHCPQRVCQPCPVGWLLFQSMCYLFTKSIFYSEWKTWAESRNSCRELNADLVMIGNREEQKFISNNTESYNTERNGYWIGYRAVMDTWEWTDGSNSTLTFWMQQNSKVYAGICALTLGINSLNNWKRTGCSMKNRWICEKRSLIK